MKYKEFIKKVNDLKDEKIKINEKICQAYADYIKELTNKFSRFQGKYVEVTWVKYSERHTANGFFEGFMASNVCGIRYIEIKLYKKNKAGKESKVMIPSWDRPGYECDYDTLTMKEI